ncbi:MAG: hypothetical protein II179_03325 [Alphaproteobacteria bacterium]|nr:hypothetical protein [Alphaproteobacteria bacterium]
MSEVYILDSGRCAPEVKTPEELFSVPFFEPYSWVFYVKNANQCVGACFCSSPLNECPVLQYALKDKNLSANLNISSRNKSEVLYGDADSNGCLYYFVFTFIPNFNPSGLQQKLLHICNKCTAIQIPWNNTKQPNKVIPTIINESLQPKR